MSGLNEQIFLFFNQSPFAGEAWYTHFMLLGSWFGQEANIALYAGVLCCCLLWRLQRTDAKPAAEYLHHLAALCLGCALAVLLTSQLKDVFHIARPYVQWPHALTPAAAMPESQSHRSFPSGHSTFAAAFATGVWPLFQRQARIVLVCTVLWVGWSRMALGVHFPADVAAGYIVGTCAVLTVQQAVAKFFPLKKTTRQVRS